MLGPVLLWLLLAAGGGHTPCAAQPLIDHSNFGRGEINTIGSLRAHVPLPTPLADAESSALRADSPYHAARIEMARRAAAHFRRSAASALPVTAEIANVNADLVARWIDMAEGIVALSDHVADSTNRLNQTQQDYEDIQAKLRRYGLTPTVGMLLRDKKAELEAWQPELAKLGLADDRWEQLRADQLDLELIRYDGSHPIKEATEILGTASYGAGADSNLVIEMQLRDLLGQRSYWIRTLHHSYDDYRNLLGMLDSTASAFAALSRDYLGLIDRHITWIRSDDPVSVADVGQLRGGIAALFDGHRSADFGPTIGRKWQSNPVTAIGLLVWLTLVAAVRWRAKSWLVGIGNRTHLKHGTQDSRTLAAALLTPLVAIAIPTMLYSVARWLSSGIVSESTLYAAHGLSAAALVALTTESARQLLRDHGLIDKHLSLDLPRRKRALAYLTLIGLGLTIAAYAIIVLGAVDHGIWRGSISRFGLMAVMLLAAWTAHLAFRPGRGFAEPLFASLGGRVMLRMRWLIYLAAIGFPVAMIGLSSAGYGYTVGVLLQRGMFTLSGALLGAPLWIGVKIAAAHGWQWLTGSTPQRRFDAYGEIESDSAAGALTEQALELKHQIAFLCQCALVLAVLAGVGWLWIDVVPVAQLGNPVVWTVPEPLQPASLTPSDEPGLQTAPSGRPITLLHLLTAGLILWIAFQLAKLLPALFDVLVLQRVSFDEGMEHLSLVLGRCVIFGLGCLVACQLLGLRWQAIQWLAVGLAIGIGFGLQDLVRNLLGGLVVLFEKPARLGDLISVGNVTGRVAAQRLRTTILADDAGREVTVPNKHFVNEEVVNWRGAGRLCIVPIEVAVKRDERPADICRMLHQLALDQDEVLLTPAPQATLVCVSKQAQRIEVRVCIEQRHDLSSYRDRLLQITKNFLRERNLLATLQPSQPAIPDSTESGERLIASRGARRKRSA